MEKIEENPKTIVIDDVVNTTLIIIGVMAVGFLAFNQGMGFFYKVHFLKSPCGLCSELNPEVDICINNLNKGQLSYWTPDGWTDPFNKNDSSITTITIPET
jgi:hypothetical protein|tara:strand:+ start:1726 stop:2028 length:303 start_codon:yes stop_codon:yes gene_type:complete